MKKLTPLIITGIVILSAVCSNAQKIMKVTDPDQANIKVFVVAEISDADLKVFEVDDPIEAKKDGLWYVQEQEQNVYMKIYMSTSIEGSDLKIFYVEDPSLVGWVKPEKRQIYKIGK